MKKVKPYEKIKTWITTCRNNLFRKIVTSILEALWRASARPVRAITAGTSLCLLLSLLGVGCQSTAPRVGPMTPDTIITARQVQKKAVQDKTRHDLENDKRWHSLIDQIGAPFETDPFK